MKKVSVVILNWNGLALMQRFLPSVVKYTPNDIADVVIADNGSDDGSLTWLKDNFPDVKIISLDENYGFTGGYNRALERVKTPYYMLLNSDVEVKEDFVTPLLSVMEADPEIAVVMPKILSQKEPNMFEYAGAAGGLVDKLYYPFCRGRILDRVEEDKGQYDVPCRIFWASGAAFFVRSEIFNFYGGFDDDFFAHCEEIDLCWRFQRGGYKIMYEPNSRVFHLGGATLENSSPRKLYYNFRNSLVMIHKNAPRGKVFSIIVKRMLFDGLIAMSYLLKRKPDYFFAVVKAHIEYYKNRKSTILKRQRLIYGGITERPPKGQRDVLVAFYAIKK
ncbi:MAG: glycosyltransferase family 2 protein [Rikenellaceae bacterium]